MRTEHNRKNAAFSRNRIRENNDGDCYRVGHVTSGQIVYDPLLHGRCWGIRPSAMYGRQWYGVEMRVRPELATLYVNGSLITKVEPTFPARATVGVLAITGFGNFILFKTPTVALRPLRTGAWSL